MKTDQKERARQDLYSPLHRSFSMTRRSFMGCSAAALWAAAAPLAGCSTQASGDSAESAGTLDKIRIGYFQSPNGELLAKGTGAAQEAFGDTQVEYTLVNVGSDVLTAIGSGSLDIATIGTPPGVLGLAQGLDYQIFYLHDLIGESEALVVRDGEGIDEVADVRGRKIATAFGSTSHLSLLGALEVAGVDPSEVELLDMTGPDTLAAWERGDIDGAYMWQPVQETLLSEGGKALVTSADMAQAGYATGEFGIVRTQFAQDHPDAVKTYIDVLDAATKRYREGSDETVSILASELGLTEEQTRTVMPQIEVLDRSQQGEYFGASGQHAKLLDILETTNRYLVEEGSTTSEKDESFFSSHLMTDLYEG